MYTGLAGIFRLRASRRASGSGELSRDAQVAEDTVVTRGAEGLLAVVHGVVSAILCSLDLPVRARHVLARAPPSTLTQSVSGSVM